MKQLETYSGRRFDSAHLHQKGIYYESNGYQR